MRKFLLVGAALLASTPTAGAETIYLHGCEGGNIAQAQLRFQQHAARGDKIVLSGTITSACGAVSNMPHGSVCAMPGTRFAVHGAHNRKGEYNAGFTEQLLNGYSPQLAAATRKRGADRDLAFHYVSAREAGVPACR